jgi:hypothetical protein
MPSFGNRGPASVPYSRPVFVSLSQNSSVGSSPSGPGPATSSRSPRNGWGTLTDRDPVASSTGADASSSQDHVLRNHTVGSTCSTSVSGPAFVTSIVINRSVGSAFA